MYCWTTLSNKRTHSYCSSKHPFWCQRWNASTSAFEQRTLLAILKCKRRQITCILISRRRRILIRENRKASKRSTAWCQPLSPAFPVVGTIQFAMASWMFTCFSRVLLQMCSCNSFDLFTTKCRSVSFFLRGTILLHDPHADLQRTGCISVVRILHAARAILECLYKVLSTSYDVTLLDCFCIVRHMSCSLLSLCTHGSFWAVCIFYDWKSSCQVHASSKKCRWQQ